MPNNQDRGLRDFSRYDEMDEEQLRQILREDASKPEGEESDTELLLYIMEVLATGRKERNEQKDPEAALESFRENYCTDMNTSLISEDVPAVRKRGWKRGLIAAAAMLVLVLGCLTTANALGVNVWETIAKWTQETFHFGSAGQVVETNEPSPSYNNSCASLQEALDTYNVGVHLAPTWMPEGYVEDDVRVAQSPSQRLFSAKYVSGDKVIAIRIANYLKTAPAQIEKNDSVIEIYTSEGVDYYILSNNDQMKAVWIVESYECSISGPVSISEIKQIIDSIGGIE